MSNFKKANKLASEWIDSMGGLDNISYIFGDDVSGLIQAFRDEGLLAPDLPEPIEGEISGILDWFPEDCEITVYPDGTDLAHVSIKPNGVDELHMKLPLSKAGPIALALLAATNYAEKEQGNE